MKDIRKGVCRSVPGSRVAVLMLHGICGTPVHFRDLIPVIPEDWSLTAVLLDGHGSSVEAFGASSMKKWKAQVFGELERLLAEHEQVIIVGHSMGTLFAIEAAIRYPDRIPFLFLLAVPTRPWVRFSTMLTCLRVALGRVRPGDVRAQKMLGATNIEMDRRLWKYIAWIPRMLELLKECRTVRRQLPLLKTKTWTYQSQVDELVSSRAAGDLEGHPFIVNTVLQDSGHFAYGAEDMRLLQGQLRTLIADCGDNPQ